MITRTAGAFIINGALFVLADGQVVSHPVDAVVESFDSAAEAEAEHRLRNPQEYAEDEYEG